MPNSHDLHDVESVARCLSGDGGAFRHIVQRYHVPVYNAVFAILGEPEEAKDAAQTAFVKAWERLETYDPSRRFFSWLYKIALNEALNRRRAVRPLQPIEMVQEVPGISEASHHEEISDRLRDSIADLPEEQKSVVLLHYFEEMSYREIGQALELPEATVKSRLYEARQKLRRVLR